MIKILKDFFASAPLSQVSLDDKSTRPKQMVLSCLLPLAVFLTLALVTAPGCGASRLVQEMKNFSKSKFRLLSVDSTTLAGVDVRRVSQASDISLADKARIVAAYAAGALPLYATLNLEAKNTTSEPASMSSFDWIMLLDGNEVATGTSRERIVLPADSTVSVPFSLPVNTDVRRLASKGPRDAIANLVLGLVDLSRNPTRLSLKIKPTIMIGSRSFKYPGYVTLTKEFNSNQLHTQ
ncbi:MAG: hypothetical protein WKF91_15960 [Segetibacter sp.]